MHSNAGARRACMLKCLMVAGSAMQHGHDALFALQARKKAPNAPRRSYEVRQQGETSCLA